MAESNHIGTTMDERNSMISAIIIFDKDVSLEDIRNAQLLWNFRFVGPQPRLVPFSHPELIAILKAAQPAENWLDKEMFIVEFDDEQEARLGYVAVKLADLRLSTAIRYLPTDRTFINDVGRLCIHFNKLYDISLHRKTRKHGVFRRASNTMNAKSGAPNSADIIWGQSVIGAEKDILRNRIENFFQQARF